MFQILELRSAVSVQLIDKLDHLFLDFQEVPQHLLQ